MSAATQPHLRAPAPQTPLIGRAREIERVSQRLLEDGVRLLTLTGPPGIGKTRLAQAVATHLRDAAAIGGDGGGRAFADGIWFVPLAAVYEAEQVLPAVARAMGVVEGGERPPDETLRAFLHDKRALLVLDNFEQVLPAAREIAELLSAAPSVRLLVTSRAALGLSAEQRFPVPPLTLPPPATEQTPAASETKGEGVDDVARYEAVRLFVARVQAAQPDFALTAENAPAVAAICQRLDGLPLAIELAAARIPVLPPRSLLGRLERRLTLLTGGARDQPARHQTLRGAIAWSYDLLSAGDQALFRRLGMFAGGASLEAVEAVCQPSGQADDAPADALSPAAGEPPSILECLASLVEKSLVQGHETAGGEPRFRMLETIREFALERLEATGEGELVRRRHARHYLAFAEAAAPWLTRRAFVEGGSWLDRLEGEHDNLLQALAWSQAAPAVAVDGGALGLRLAAALGQFWRRCGHWIEGRRWLAGALALPAAAQPTVAGATALQAAGALAALQGHFATGRDLLEQAVALWRELGDRQGLAWALCDLVWPLGNLGAHEAGRLAAAESVALCRELGDRAGLALALRWLAGPIGHQAGASVAALRQAEALCEESVALFRELGDEEGAAMPLANLADYARARGDFAAARSLLEQVVALRRTATRGGRGGYVASALLSLGVATYIEGDAARAEQHFVEALVLYRNAGHRHGAAGALGRLGDLERGRGHTARAAELYTESLDLARQAGYAALAARALAGLGDLARAAGDLAQAGARYAAGVAAIRPPAVSPPDALKGAAARCLTGLAKVAAAQEQLERAARLLGAAPTPLMALGWRLEPPDATDHAAAVEVARAALGEPAFAAAFGAGQAMSLAQTCAYALQEEDQPTPAPAAAETAETAEATTLRSRADGLTQVTPREREVAALVATGLANREIASRLHVTERTVENHVRHILAKLGFRTRVQIATWVTERGLAAGAAR